MAVNVFHIRNPVGFALPEIHDLIHRGFADPKFDVDADEMLRYLIAHVRDDPPWLQVWVAYTDRDPCGFIIVSYAPWPLGPNPCVAHLHVERPEAREALVNRAFAWGWSHGARHCSIVNATGHPDETHMRLFRKYGRGRVIGSLINYDLEDRHVGRIE